MTNVYDQFDRPVGGNVYDQFDAPSAESTPSATDYLKGVASGVGGIASGVGYLAEAAGADKVGAAIRGVGDTTQQYWKDAMTPAGKRAVESQVFEDDPGSVLPKIGDRWGQALGMGVAQSAPSMLAAAIPGGIAATGLRGIASLAASRGIGGALAPLAAGTAAPVGGWATNFAGNLAARSPTALAFGASEGAVAGASNAAQWKSDIEQKPLAELRNMPGFAALEAQIGERAARQQIAEQGAADIMARTTLSTGGIGALTGGGALGSAFQRVTTGAKGGIIGAIGRDAAKEVGQELLQSGGERAVQNVATRDYLDPNQSVMQGVASDALSGAAIGGVMGGVTGGGSYLAKGPLQKAADAAATTSSTIPQEEGQGIPQEEGQGIPQEEGQGIPQEEGVPPATIQAGTIPQTQQPAAGIAAAVQNTPAAPGTPFVPVSTAAPSPPTTQAEPAGVPISQPQERAVSRGNETEITQPAEPGQQAQSAKAADSAAAEQEWRDFVATEGRDIGPRQLAVILGQIRARRRQASGIEAATGRVEDARQREVAANRMAVLESLPLTTTGNTIRRFPAALRNAGIRDYRVSPEERQMISRRIDARDTLQPLEQNPTNELTLPEKREAKAVSPTMPRMEALRRKMATPGARLVGNRLLDRHGKRLDTLSSDEAQELAPKKQQAPKKTVADDELDAFIKEEVANLGKRRSMLLSLQAIRKQKQGEADRADLDALIEAERADLIERRARLQDAHAAAREKKPFVVPPLRTPEQPTTGGRPIEQQATSLPLGEFGVAKKQTEQMENKPPVTYKGMTVEQMAKVASQHGHVYEDALHKIQANPGRWVNTVVEWRKADIAARLHERKLKRAESFEPNEKQKKVIALVYDSPTYSKDRDLPMAPHNARSTQALLARGALSRIEYGDMVEYRVNEKPAPVTSLQTPPDAPQQPLSSSGEQQPKKAHTVEAEAKPAADDIGAIFDKAMDDVFGEAPAAPAQPSGVMADEVTEPSITRRANPGAMQDRSFVARAFIRDGDIPIMGVGATEQDALIDMMNDADRKRSDLVATNHPVVSQSKAAPKPATETKKDAFQENVAGIAKALQAKAKTALVDKVPDARKPTEAAASAAKNASMGLADVAKGLNALFKPKPGTLGMGLPFDEDTYAAAKPYFQAGIAHFKQAGADIAEMMKSLIMALRDQFGMDRETITAMKPYVVRFMEDAKAGKLDYDEASTAGNTDEATTRNASGTTEVQEVGSGGDAKTRRSGGDVEPPAPGANLEGVEGVSPTDAGTSGNNEPGGKVRGPDASENVGGSGKLLEGGDAVAGLPGTGGAGVADDVPGRGLGNYHVADPEALIGGSPRVRFARNKAAIETFQIVSSEGRAPTQEERDTIARFIGWGSFGQELFNGSWHRPAPKPEWKEADAWLREHLGKEEWESAQASIINAHYTDPPTVQTMWNMVRQMGFTGGRVLEPSMGIGNFFGMMPRDLMERSQLTGIEMDSLTGGMAKMLYPDANINIKPYQDSKTSDGFYDLVIGNWPFAAKAPLDRRYMRLSPTLHDYFFLKALDQTRAGGIVIGITSSGTMDKAGEASRYAIAKKADLIGAFRLPSGAFEKYAGTSVVTDILVFRKREEENPSASSVPWLKTEEAQTPQGTPVKINAYFANNPQFVLGTTNYGHGTTRGVPGMIVDRPGDMMDRLQAIPGQLPEDAYSPAITNARVSFISNHTNDRQQSVTTGPDNGLYVVDGEHLKPLHEAFRYVVKDAKKTAAREAQVRALIALRKAYASLLDAERGDEKAATIARKKLNAIYKAFVNTHGTINGSDGLNILHKVGDPFFPSLAALEVKTDQEYVPAAILSRPTMRAAKALSDPTVSDAFVLARNKSMVLDMESLAKDAGVTVAEATRELVSSGAVFKTPVGNYEVSDVYLSGNVRRKLHEAEAALKDGDADMATNIEALKKVIPHDEPYYRIEAKLGAPWISPAHYRTFVAELLGVKGRDVNGIHVENRMGRWVVAFTNPSFNRRPEAMSVWGTDSYPFSKLVRAAMNNLPVTIRVRDSDGNLVVAQVATEEANTKIANLREHFSSWVWSDIDRRTGLEKEYNEVMRAIAAPKFDGSFLGLAGMALQRGKHEFNLRQHQVDAIWRGLVNQMGIYAHEVGTGKTYTMAGLAIESRRYGLARKPLIFAHNANSASVAREFQEMYPAAKLLYIDNLSPSNIATTMRQIANDDWDAVIVPHSLIERFALTQESLDEIAREEIALLEEEAMLAAAEDNSSLTREMMSDDVAMRKVRSPTAKELVKARNLILARIARMAAQSSREDAISFEELGVDMIIVDEAHEFKKPPLVTRMKMKGLNKGTSNRSVSLRFLTDYVKKQNSGKGVHLFTGTPITNTLTEIYNLQRYVADIQMQRDGVKDWDAWFSTFADSLSDVELTSTGEYDAVTRLSTFINTADLRNMIGAYTDIVFADDMPEFKPRSTESGKTLNSDNLSDVEKDFLLNGKTDNPIGRPYKKVVNDVADMTEDQREYLATLQQRATAFKNAQPRERKRMSTEGHINAPIIIDNQAPAVGLDPRFFDLSAEDHPNLKVNRAAKNILRHYNEDLLATQVVFVERGYVDNVERTRRDAGGWPLRNSDRKPITEIAPTFNLVSNLIDNLVNGGIPRAQIAIVSGSTSRDRRMAISDEMNAGTIRVVIGMTSTLGIGVNMQKHVRAMHHLDAPWMPGDLEQRNGRGQRQGNQWNTVLEYRYITDRVDGRRWQVLAIKDRFIKQFLKANSDTRIIEGDAVSDSEGDTDIMESLSEAAGDPRIMLRQKLKKDVEQLERRLQMHEMSRRDSAWTMRNLTNEIAEKRVTLAAFGQDIEAAQPALEKGQFSITIDGRAITERQKADAAIKNFVDNMDSYRGGEQKLGSIGQFDIILNIRAGQLYGYIKGPGRIEYSVQPSVASITTTLRNLQGRAEHLLGYIKDKSDSLPRLKEAADAPFPRADVLAQKQKLLQQLEADLQQNPVPPPPWLRQGAPVETFVYVNGKPYVVEGHQHGKDGFYVIIGTPRGPRRLHYGMARDEHGMDLYEAHLFTPPVSIAPTLKKGDEVVSQNGMQWVLQAAPKMQDGVLIVLAKEKVTGSTEELRVDTLKPAAEQIEQIPLFNASRDVEPAIAASEHEQEQADQIQQAALSGALPGERQLARYDMQDNMARDSGAMPGESRFSKASGIDALSHADRAVYSMAAEGKSAQEILSFLSKASRRPFNRVLANALSRIGVSSSVSVDQQAGWRNVQNRQGARFAASYNPKTDTVSLFTPREAERHILHEFVHPATMTAIARGGPAARQMQAIFDYVQKTGTMSDQYGMGNFSRFPNETDAQFKKRALDEFVAELFTNGQFRFLLKQLLAPPGSKLKSVWDWIVRVIANILGLRTKALETALDRALSVGVALLQENADLTMPKGETARYHTTWHGSPHKFYTFDLSKSLTGEGANAFGAGIYVAEEPNVADSYRKMLQDKGNLVGNEPLDRNNPEHVASLWMSGGGTRQQAIAELRAFAAKYKNQPSLEAALILESGADVPPYQKGGALYKVDIPAEAVARMLDWDADLNDNPRAVKIALEKDDWDTSTPDEDSYFDSTTGEDVMRELFDELGSKQAVSEHLLSIGIQGVRYLDQQSRSGEKATSNFVLFDDKLARIIEVNGVETGVQPWAPGEWEAAKGGERFSQANHGTDYGVLFHDKNENAVVWAEGDYRVTVNKPGNASLATLWAKQTVNGKEHWGKRGSLNTFESRKIVDGNADNWLRIQEISIEKEHRGKGLAKHLYNALLHQAAPDVRGILSHVPSITNKREVPALHAQLGAVTSADGDFKMIYRPAKNDGNPFDGRETATGNTGAFSEDPDIRYSAADNWQQSPVAREVAKAFKAAASSDEKLSWLNPVQTQYHKAERLAQQGKFGFKRVFDLGQKFLSDISRFAIMAENSAPTLFHQIRSAADVKQTIKAGLRGDFGKQHNADIRAIAAPLYEGTLYGGGNPMAGIVWTDEQLRDKFGLTDNQIKLYHEARDAVKVSMDEMAKSLIAKHAKRERVSFDDETTLAGMSQRVAERLEERIADIEQLVGPEAQEEAEAAIADLMELDEKEQAAKVRRDFKRMQESAKADIERLEQTILDVQAIADKAQKLQAAGYFPLMRFGRHTVTAKDENGKVQHFSMHDGIPLVPRSGQAQANLLADALREEHPEWTVETGLMNPELYKLYQGMNIDALQLFSDHLDEDTRKTYQEVIRLATNERSALKRMLKREGTPGFDRDVRRTLASFILSNARYTSSAYNLADMAKAAEDANEDGGDIGAEAVKMYEYVAKPQEEAAKIRGFLFFNFLGGSLAAAMVNATQVPMMTFPRLAQYEQAGKLAARLGQAAKLAIRNPAGIQGDIGEALRRAEENGITAPHQIYEMTATAANNIFTGSRAGSALLRAWGAPFALAESFNRRTTFIAAYQIGRQMTENQLRDAGAASAFEFAEKIVQETQGIYNRGNRVNLGRGKIGATVMTFKQFSIMYLEMFSRLPARQKAIMAGMLILAAGAGGLPFAEDIEDIIDTIGQWLGYRTNTRRAIRRGLADLAGQRAADIAMNGVLSQMGVDLHSRLGLQNIIPGSAIMKPSTTDKSREFQDLLGPAASVVASFGQALQDLATGRPLKAAEALAPVAVQNAVKGARMAATGRAEDMRGKPTIPVSAAEAAAKGIGFNPKAVADYGTAKRDIMQDERLLDVTRERFTAAIVDAIIAGDDEARREALQQVMEWNRRNPDARININPASIRRRVADMRAEGPARVLKSLSPSLRQQAQQELADAR